MTTFVHELISHSVQRSPEAIALQVKNISLSYAQLNEKITKVAQAYASLSITCGDRIGIYLAKNQENVQSIVAIGNKLKGDVQELVNIVGPLCTPLDILADKVMLPKANLGDYVVVFQSGAYGATASPKDFLSQPQVSELLI